MTGNPSHNFTLTIPSLALDAAIAVQCSAFHIIPFLVAEEFPLFRFAARCCVPQPDVTAITIRPEEFARIVLASDGLWDVVTEALVLKTIQYIPNPKLAAEKIALLAWQKRLDRLIKSDDITVLVVDVHSMSKDRIMTDHPQASSGCVII